VDGLVGELAAGKRCVARMDSFCGQRWQKRSVVSDLSCAGHSVPLRSLQPCRHPSPAKMAPLFAAIDIPLTPQNSSWSPAARRRSRGDSWGTSVPSPCYRSRKNSFGTQSHIS